MNYNSPYKLLKNLPKKLGKFYVKNSKYGLKINNKSKNKKNYDPVTNLDKAFEKFIRNIIIRHFPKDAILGEEFLEKKSNNDFRWYVDPIDGTYDYINNLEQNNLLNEEDISKMESSIENLINVSWKKAQNDEYPKVEALLTRVYSDEE